MSERVGLRRRLLDGWLVIVARFGDVQTLVILGIFYALLIGPAAIGARIGRADMLQKRRLEPGSAWGEADTAGAALERSKLQS
jgi:hypothetical protein